MAAILGVREQRSQFFYDTDYIAAGVVTTGQDLAIAEKNLFSQTLSGDLSRSNLQTQGQLTSDQTFICHAVRHEVNFWGGTSSATPTPAALATTAGCSILTIQHSTFAFQVADKVAFAGPISMTPAGGGPWGFISDSAQPLIVNGEPQTRSIYPLGLPVPIAARQGIRVVEKKHDITIGTNATISIAGLINNYSGVRIFRAYLDGFHTRDVQ